MSLLLLFGGGVGSPVVFSNRVKWRSSTSGLSDFVVSAAITGYMTPETAGLDDANTMYTVSYTAESDDLSQWETGQGIYIVGTTTLQRTTVRESSDGTEALGFDQINFTAAPTVWMDFHAQDIGLYLYDSATETWSVVSLGAADSGGTGFRLLRVGN